MNCGRCGQPNSEGKRFCGDCGAPLPIASTAPESAAAERRQLSVFFCDMVGSTALSTELDPEELRDCLLEYRRQISVEVRAAGGYIAQHLGDGVMALFGYPSAGEFDAEHAVRAALACTRAASQITAATGQAINVRIGISTGTVVVGDVLDAWDTTERGVIGEAPNIAARLQSIAVPGTVVVCHATRRLCGAWFRFDDLGLVPIKGLGHGLRSWLVRSESGVFDRFEAHHQNSLPLVGRNAERAQLESAWFRALSGQGCTAVIEGEAGIGKSSLLQSLSSLPGVTGATAIQLQCLPHQGSSAFEPVVRFLVNLTGIDHGDDAQSRRIKLAAAGGDSTSAVDLDALCRLLGVSDPLAHQSRLSPNELREATFTAVVNLLVARARSKSLLLLWEDMQWSDPSSVNLLQRLAGLIHDVPILIVCTTRPDEGFAAHALPGAHRIALERLDSEQAAALAGNIAGSPLTKQALDEIAARTDGVPLFVEEMTRALLEEAALVLVNGEYQLLTAKAYSIPSSLQATLAARLSRLGSARGIAQLASVIGREFDERLLETLWAGHEPSLQECLAKLVDARLIQPRNGSNGRIYAFKHALVQGAAYDSLLRIQRREIHGRVAEAIERHTPEEAAATPEIVARHFRLGGYALRAVDYMARAAALAQSRFSYREAAAQLEEALLLIRALPAAEQDQARELKLLFPLASAKWMTGELASLGLRDVFARALDLLESGPPLMRFMAAEGVYRVYVNRGEVANASKASEHMWRLQRESGSQDMLRHCWRATGAVNLFEGHFPAAVEALDEAERPLAEPSFLDEREVVDHLIMVRGFKVLALTIQGRIGEASDLEDATVERGRSLQGGVGLALALAICGPARAMRGRMASVRSWAAELEPLARRLGIYFVQPTASLLARASAEDNAAQWNDDELERHVEGMRTTGGGWAIWATCQIAAGCIQSGHIDQALRVLDLGSGLQDESGARWFASDLRHLRARCALMQGRLDSALADLLPAVEIAQRQGANYFLLKALTTLLRAFPDGGPLPGARVAMEQTLAPMRAWATDPHVRAALEIEAR